MERERQLLEQQDSRRQLEQRERELKEQRWQLMAQRRQLEVERGQLLEQQDSRGQLKRPRQWEPQQEIERELKRQRLLEREFRLQSAQFTVVQWAPPSPPVLLDLTPLPDELLARILSWVPGCVLVTHCRLVCRRWRDLIDGPTVWRLQGERCPGLGATLAAARLCLLPQWSRICLLEPFGPGRPFGRNLLRNPCGQDQFSHWQVEHGGHGWKVEENRCPVEGAPAQTCFVSSYHWCVKSQLVDLLKEGLWEELLDTYQPEIYISDWWGTRCGCEYSICVKLLAANRSTVIAEFQASPDGLQQSNDSQYHQVSYRFRQYGRGVRYVHFLHRGKDAHFRLGRYGAQITNSTVMVKLN
ncbi:F-box only protein 17-like [Emys orbicularis]|uniref:F-box only protein 17-like n=1 Tax=Emys orbicularis TaxID=82168 RepID=UPI0031FDD01C